MQRDLRQNVGSLCRQFVHFAQSILTSGDVVARACRNSAGS
jgi:hypothetical protein